MRVIGVFNDHCYGVFVGPDCVACGDIGNEKISPKAVRQLCDWAANQEAFERKLRRYWLVYDEKLEVIDDEG